MIPITIEEKVKNLKDIDSIFELFEFLGYKEHLFDKSYKRNKTDFNLPKDTLPNIKKIYSVFNIEQYLYCFFIETKNISRPFLKAVSKSLLDSYIRVLLIFTDDWETYYFTLPQYEKHEGKRKLKLSTLIVDTKQIYRTDLEVISTLNITQEETYRDIWRNCWQQAFNKERVNDEFFEDFEKVFFDLRTLVFNQIKDVKLAHEFAQQTLNRLIFLYFIAKKGWLASDKKFISNFYKEYKIERNKGNSPKDSFYENWLKILFFEVFNKSFPNLGIARYIPAEFKNNLIMFPYLNGGLFNEEDFDKVGVNIPDSTFNNIFAFLDKYNFTIKEDSPLDIEVAVDPQMLGYLYESFANIAEEIYERNDLGVFYTPVSEVDFMVRRSLVEYFANHLQKIPKDFIYKFVFDEDKKETIEYINKHDLWEDLEFLIEDVKIVDPACGSGAFLLGCLKVLVELTQVIERHLDRERKDFDIKKDIIGKNFFGVDVMKWALHCAELRLWLSMIVEADLPFDRRKEALLPNFNLRLRVGDSLVQKIGGISVDLRDLTTSKEIKRKLKYLREEEQKYYRNDPSRKFDNYEAIQKEEIRIFQEILREEIKKLDKEIKPLRNLLDNVNQLNIFGEPSKEKTKKENIRNEIKLLEEKEKQIEKAYNELKSKGKQFVIWEIDFVDVFEEKGGFDVVIGNPPYIRQEKISPPFRSKKEVSLKEKIKYKNDLIDSIKIKYPFIKEFDRKCDYYIYFYFHGLSLLNSKGTFCFITSNSWLDVGYGKGLQEFLIKYVPIKAIYDNQSKRSFEHASINTVIVFFDAPLIKNSKNPNTTCLDNVAKFTMLKKPYEEVISSQNLILIDKFNPDNQNLFGNILKKDQLFRVYAIKQRDLLEEGIEIKQSKNDMFDNKLFGKYVSSKWGGKYLRAPDIYFTILKKGKDKLVRLGDIAEVRRGFTTGANEFFYVEDVTDKIEFLQIKSKIKNIGNFSNIKEIKEAGLKIIHNKKGDSYWLIEKEFLKPVLTEIKNSKNIKIETNEYIFIYPDIDFRKTKYEANNYIKWGAILKTSGRQKQKKGIPLPQIESLQARKYWYSFKPSEQLLSDIFWQKRVGERFATFYSKNKIFVDQKLYPLSNVKCLKENLVIVLNSIIQRLFLEVDSISYTGSYTLIEISTESAKRLFIIDPNKIKNILKYDLSNKNFKSIFQELDFNSTKPIREQQPNPLPDRKALDDIIFDALDLTGEERKEVYWATAELVKNRLDKARSVKKK